MCFRSCKVVMLYFMSWLYLLLRLLSKKKNVVKFVCLKNVFSNVESQRPNTVKEIHVLHWSEVSKFFLEDKVHNLMSQDLSSK